jgi:hypothetical protein
MVGQLPGHAPCRDGKPEKENAGQVEPDGVGELGIRGVGRAEEALLLAVALDEVD